MPAADRRHCLKQLVGTHWRLGRYDLSNTSINQTFVSAHLGLTYISSVSLKAFKSFLNHFGFVVTVKIF